VDAGEMIRNGPHKAVEKNYVDNKFNSHVRNMISKLMRKNLQYLSAMWHKKAIDCTVFPKPISSAKIPLIPCKNKNYFFMSQNNK